MKIAIVASKFNGNIVERLLEGAKKALDENHITTYEIFRVPGAFEIPVMCKHLIKNGKYDALIALGAVIKGATDHYEHVCRTCSDGIAKLSLETGIPIIFEVLMCHTIEQALERSSEKMGNRGYDAGLCAIEMVEMINNFNIQ